MIEESLKGTYLFNSSYFFLFQFPAINQEKHILGHKAVNREDKLSRRYRDRDLAKFERSRRYRER